MSKFILSCTTCALRAPHIDEISETFKVDTGHFYWAKVDTPALIRKFASKIWNVHLKDHKGPQSVAIGAGNIDIKEIITVLHEIDYEGALALEIEPKDTENLPRYVAESYPLLSRMVEEVTVVKPE